MTNHRRHILGKGLASSLAALGLFALCAELEITLGDLPGHTPLHQGFKEKGEEGGLRKEG